VGAAVTVFTAEEMQRRDAPVVAELLRATPGVTVVRAGGVGNVTSLFVRGGESSHNKVMLDGIPLNEPGGTFNFSNLTTDFVERIEVVRGAQSALFGSDAMSSVVQLISRRPVRGLSHPTILASGEAGSYRSHRGSASVGASGDKWDASLHGGRQHTDNRVPNNEFTNTTVAGNGGVMLSSAMSLRLVGRTEFGRTGVPGATAFGRADMDAFFHRRDGVIGATFEHQVSERWQQRATYALSVSHQQSTNLEIDPPYVPRFEGHVAPFTFADFPYDSLTDLRRHFISYQADARIGGGAANEQMLTFAFDVNGERGVLTNRMAGSVVRASRDNFGWTAQHQWFGARASIASGLRIEQNDSFGTAVAPRLSIAVAAAANTKLKINAGLGVKEPTILQSFSPSPSFLGNPDLEPERATTVDAGIEQRLLAQRVKIEALWFNGHYKNIISTRTISFTPFPVAVLQHWPDQGARRRAGAGYRTGRRIAPPWCVHVDGFSNRTKHVADQSRVCRRRVGIPAPPSLGVRGSHLGVRSIQRRRAWHVHRTPCGQRLLLAWCPQSSKTSATRHGTLARATVWRLR
jgi:vitamin B12 transporter